MEGKIPKPILVTMGILLFAILAFLVFRWWFVSRMDFLYIGQPSPITNEVAKKLDALTDQLKNRKLPLRTEDLSSVGSVSEEDRLIDLSRLLQFYETGFGPPKGIKDFDRLLENKGLSARERKTVVKDVQECRIFVFPMDSYLLNCDGWLSSTVNDVQDLISHFDVTTTKFYNIDHHVFLYAPPFYPLSPVK